MNLKTLMACTLAGCLCLPPSLSAQSHVVTPEELRAAVVNATELRQKNRATVVAFLSTAQADKALRTARLDAKFVKAAVSSLSDDELAQLTARAEQARSDFAAGRLSDRDLLWIVVGIAALILIIVAVD